MRLPRQLADGLTVFKQTRQVVPLVDVQYSRARRGAEPGTGDLGAGDRIDKTRLAYAVGPQSMTTSRGSAGAPKRSPCACASIALLDDRGSPRRRGHVRAAPPPSALSAPTGQQVHLAVSVPCAFSRAIKGEAGAVSCACRCVSVGEVAPKCPG